MFDWFNVIDQARIFFVFLFNLIFVISVFVFQHWLTHPLTPSFYLNLAIPLKPNVYFAFQVFGLLEKRVMSSRGRECPSAMGCDIWEWILCCYDLLIGNCFSVSEFDIWHHHRSNPRKYLDNILQLNCMYIELELAHHIAHWYPNDDSYIGPFNFNKFCDQ